MSLRGTRVVSALAAIHLTAPWRDRPGVPEHKGIRESFGRYLHRTKHSGLALAIASNYRRAVRITTM